MLAKIGGGAAVAGGLGTALSALSAVATVGSAVSANKRAKGAEAANQAALKASEAASQAKYTSALRSTREGQGTGDFQKGSNSFQTALRQITGR